MISYLVNWIIKSLVVINQYVGSWGYTIILFALIVRLIIFPFYIKQFRYMQKMKQLQPEIARIRESSTNPTEDEAKLYMNHGINPLATLPIMLLQALIFISVFSAFRDQKLLSIICDPFLGWNLLERDPSYLLPAINTSLISLSALRSGTSSIFPFAIAGFMFFISMNWSTALLICMISLSTFNLIQDSLIRAFKLDG